MSSAEAEVSKIAKLLDGITPYQMSLAGKVQHLISELEALRASRLQLLEINRDHEEMINNAKLALGVDPWSG